MNNRFANASAIIVTGADAYHFSNLSILIASWRSNNPGVQFVVCDFGFTLEQIEVLKKIGGLHYLPNTRKPFTHPWEGKAAIKWFLAALNVKWDLLIWIDADALFLHPYPDLPSLLEGYDMIIDAHVQSIGEIMHECNREVLNVRKDDAYFGAGCWIARRGVLLESYHDLTQLVKGKGNLWECDAFVAAIYHERLRLRTVSGGVWHARGKTSLGTCTVDGLKAYHENQPIYVLHANAEYTVRDDGRRRFNRPDLLAIQDYYEGKFWSEIAGKA
jgi:hypothetical protein